MKTWGITNAGLVRSENQDAYAVFQTGAFHAAVVCDGMGGTNGGRVASAIAVSRFEEELRSALRDDMTAAQVRQAMLSAIACANDAIRQEAARNAEYQHMGTTLDAELARYDAVLHLSPPTNPAFYQSTHVRTESLDEAFAIDRKILKIWENHPNRLVVDGKEHFIEKAEIIKNFVEKLIQK